MIDQYWNTILNSEHTDAYTNTAALINKDINGFIEFNPKDERFVDACSKYNEHQDNVLSDVPFAIKNNIALEQVTLSCASALLADFVSPISADSITRLLKKGLIPVGITNMDEFGMGSATTNSIFGHTKNPWDLTLTAGGSSGGSAAVVSAGIVPFALGSDTGGSVRQPAGFCGIWGFKPTHGSVSRYGLVAFASSLDVIGILAEHPKWFAPVFETMRVTEKDPKDASSYYPSQTPHTHTKKIAMFISDKKNVHSDILEGIHHTKAQYIHAGYEVDEIDLPIFDYTPAVYQNISAAEASSNLARFDGIRYGNRGGFADNKEELINNARSKGFGDEVKLRVITGGFVLRAGFQDQYYLKAQKIRAYLSSVVKKIFTQYDLLVLPLTPTQAFPLEGNTVDPFTQKMGDAYSVLANLVGVPAASFPVMWKNNLPIGMQALAPHYAEERLFQFLTDTYSLFEYMRSPYAQTMYKNTSRTWKEV